MKPILLSVIIAATYSHCGRRATNAPRNNYHCSIIFRCSGLSRRRTSRLRMCLDSAPSRQPYRYIFYQHSRKVIIMPAKTINLARSPFKRHALSRATDWTKRRDLCGTLISQGGSTPADTFEYRRKAIVELCAAGLMASETRGQTIYVRTVKK